MLFIFQAEDGVFFGERVNTSVREHFERPSCVIDQNGITKPDANSCSTECCTEGYDSDTKCMTRYKSEINKKGLRRECARLRRGSRERNKPATKMHARGALMKHRGEERTARIRFEYGSD